MANNNMPTQVYPLAEGVDIRTLPKVTRLHVDAVISLESQLNAILAAAPEHGPEYEAVHEAIVRAGIQPLLRFAGIPRHREVELRTSHGVIAFLKIRDGHSLQVDDSDPYDTQQALKFLPAIIRDMTISFIQHTHKEPSISLALMAYGDVQ